MNDRRPVNHGLFTSQIPIAAAVSFIVRASGIALLVVVGFLLWMLDKSLSSQEGFNEIQTLLGSLPFKIVLWILLLPLVYHVVAGVRHLLMDAGFFEDLSSGRQSAISVVVIFVAISLILAVWIF
jgi:succinate dehydrogenase cytochrome b subunit